MIRSLAETPSRVQSPCVHSPGVRSSSVLPWAIAAVLLLAALTKGDEAWHEPSIGLWMIVVLEGLLAVWLASGSHLRAGWNVTLGTFLIFSIITGWKAAHAAVSCGCFGYIEIPPVVTFAMDALIVALLVMFYPRSKANHQLHRWQGGMAVGVLAVIALLAIRHQSPAADLQPAITASTQPGHSTQPSTQPSAATNPQPFDAVAKMVSLAQWQADVGTVHPGETLHILFNLTSPTGNDLQVRGVNVSCGCTSVPKPPETIAGKGYTPVEVIIHVLDHSGVFEDSVQLTTNVPTLPPLALIVKGRTP